MSEIQAAGDDSARYRATEQAGIGDGTRRAELLLPARFGRYRLIRLLAVGGMAEIYLAKSFGAEGFVKQLVIKRLDPRLGDDPFYTRLFVNEAKLLVSLNHGNIVPVFDFGRVGQDLFIAMEHIDGLPLRDLLAFLRREDKLLDPIVAAHIAAEVCKGLDYAHRKCDPGGEPSGIIHRDIKPTNILLSSEGEVKIVDFGVAKLATRTGDGRLSGTIAYMSPEQAEREQVDPRTDIFSAGLVLYEMLAGQPAYQADDNNGVQSTWLLARQAQVPTLPETIPAELREIVAKATQQDPDERYQSADEMERSLAEYLLLARSVGVDLAGDTPASRLRALIRDVPGLDDSIEDDEAFEAIDEGIAPTVSLMGSKEPIDLKMIREAAETFHSEVLTRALVGLPQPSSGKRWVILGIVALVVIAVVGVGWQLTATNRTASTTSAADASSTQPVNERHHGFTRVGAGRPAQEVEEAVDQRVVQKGAASDKARTPRVRRRRNRGYGQLRLNSVPWSEVTIDGRKLPKPTPILDLKLSAGVHQVSLHNPERDLRKTFRVRIRAGETISRLVRLK